MTRSLCSSRITCSAQVILRGFSMFQSIFEHHIVQLSKLALWLIPTFYLCSLYHERRWFSRSSIPTLYYGRRWFSRSSRCFTRPRQTFSFQVSSRSRSSDMGSSRPIWRLAHNGTIAVAKDARRYVTREKQWLHQLLCWLVCKRIAASL